LRNRANPPARNGTNQPTQGANTELANPLSLLAEMPLPGTPASAPCRRAPPGVFAMLDKCQEMAMPFGRFPEAEKRSFTPPPVFGSTRVPRVGFGVPPKPRLTIQARNGQAIQCSGGL